MRTFFIQILLVLFAACFVNPQNVHGISNGLVAYDRNYKFDDILLVVHYNHPHYETKEFIQNLYPCFPDIVFYGDIPGTCDQFLEDVILVPTQRGYFFSRVVADALRRFSDYRGYIFLQDDALMNFWNFSRLNKDKIWFGVSFYNFQTDRPLSWDVDFEKTCACFELFNPIHNAEWQWWKTNEGLLSLEPAMNKLQTKDRKKLERNIGEIGEVGMVCDMFYLPQTVREDAIRLSTIFSDVFCEIAIPMMLVCLDDFENWELLKGAWGVNIANRSFPIPEYQNDMDWIHPVKFSNPCNRDFAQMAVDANTKSIP